MFNVSGGVCLRALKKSEKPTVNPLLLLVAAPSVGRSHNSARNPTVDEPAWLLCQCPRPRRVCHGALPSIF